MVHKEFPEATIFPDHGRDRRITALPGTTACSGTTSNRGRARSTSLSASGLFGPAVWRFCGSPKNLGVAISMGLERVVDHQLVRRRGHVPLSGRGLRPEVATIMVCRTMGRGESWCGRGTDLGGVRAPGGGAAPANCYETGRMTQ
jgi:hypothetical protein